jgi:hypothetical protein
VTAPLRILAVLTIITAGIMATGVANGHPLSKDMQFGWLFAASLWALNTFIGTLRRK